jgi:hypothetical protein
VALNQIKGDLNRHREFAADSDVKLFRVDTIAESFEEHSNIAFNQKLNLEGPERPKNLML